MPGQSQTAMPKHLPPSPDTGDTLHDDASDVSLVGRTVEEVERTLVLQTLAHHRGNRTAAARALGISVRTLRNKIREYHASGVAVPEAGRAPPDAAMLNA